MMEMLMVGASKFISSTEGDAHLCPHHAGVRALVGAAGVVRVCGVVLCGP